MKFNELVEACFGQSIRPNYSKVIQEFEEMYRNLTVSVTPKVHLIFSHLTEFLETKKLVGGLDVGVNKQWNLYIMI